MAFRFLVYFFILLVPAVSLARSQIVEKIEHETGIPMTIQQKEDLAFASENKYVALKEARDILVRQLSQILSLPEKSIREELFSEVGLPHAELNPVTGAKLEKLLGREMTKTEYELVDMAFKAWKDKEKTIYGEHAAQVANLVDLPQDTVQNLISR